MKRRQISALLAGAICALSIIPAGAAVGSTGASALQTQQMQAAIKVQQMGLGSVEEAVQKNNPTVRSLRKMAAGLDTTSDIAAQLEQQGTGLQMQLAAYDKMIADMQRAMEGLTPDSDLYLTYTAQIRLLEGQKTALEQDAGGMAAQGQGAILQIEDAVFTLRKQAQNVADQLSSGAQTLLITIKNMQLTEEKLKRQLAALDRGLDVMQTQLALGMISQYQLDTMRGQRDDLARGIHTLRVQYENLGSSLALMCGFDADTRVMPSDLPGIYTGDLQAMHMEKDLEQALENSFTIWQKRSALRKAQGSYEEGEAASEQAVQSAKYALSAEEDAVKTAFLTIFKTVSDCKSKVEAAQAAAKQASLDLSASELQYARGMISKLSFLQAQDALADARLAVETAEFELLSAFKQYEWAKRGVIAAARG